MPESSCPYWKTGQCIYRQPAIRCNGSQLHFQVGIHMTSLVSCNERLAELESLVEAGQAELLNDCLTGNNLHERLFAKTILEKHGVRHDR
jgi:hypothetical protein